MMADVTFTAVPYKGVAPAITDLLGGHVALMFCPMASVVGQVRGGNLRAIAVTGARRSPLFPDVPTVAEILPGYDASGWHGIGVPKNTPADIVESLNKAVNADLADGAFKAKLADLGGMPAPMTSAQFGKFIADETEKWAKVNKFADIKAE